MNINFNNLLKYFMPICISIFTAYFCMTLLFFVLPKRGVNFVIDESVLNQKTQDSKKTQRKVSSFSKGLILAAIYQQESSASWIVLKDENQDKTFFLKEKDLYKGMKIKKITSSSVVFSGNGNEHILTMKTNQKDIKDIINNGAKL